jgi:hypothetical protein
VEKLPEARVFHGFHTAAVEEPTSELFLIHTLRTMNPQVSMGL